MFAGKQGIQQLLLQQEKTAAGSSLRGRKHAGLLQEETR
jgi:hypothetical protein